MMLLSYNNYHIINTIPLGTCEKAYACYTGNQKYSIIKLNYGTQKLYRVLRMHKQQHKIIQIYVSETFHEMFTTAVLVV